MSESSPFIQKNDFDTKKKEPTEEVTKGGKESSFNTWALVITIVVIVIVLYYAMSCYSGKNPKKLKSSKKIDSNLEKFDVEREVEKLRIKQDEYKARV